MKAMISFEIDVPEVEIDDTRLVIPVRIITEMIKREWEIDTVSIIEDYVGSHCPNIFELIKCSKVNTEKCNTVECWKRRFAKRDNRKT